MKVALIISILLQLAAAIFAIGLTKKTKYNASWILISLAFLIIAFRRFIELLEILKPDLQFEIDFIYQFLGVLVSIMLILGVVFIRKLFIYLQKLDDFRKESERKILDTIMQTEEYERLRFAKDLHDGLGPLLSNIKMSLSAFDKSNMNEFNQHIAETSVSVVDKSISSLKSISNNLSPHILENFGLVSALNGFIENIQKLKLLQIKFNHNLSKIRFSENIEITIYRVIGELINNTIKHAEAKKIFLKMMLENDQLKIIYTDDGVGFSKFQNKETSGMGISNIISRLKTINGNLEIQSQKYNGFLAEITILSVKVLRDE
jgi:signal transduction histidine kinase